jgi:hypothetical protein
MTNSVKIGRRACDAAMKQPTRWKVCLLRLSDWVTMTRMDQLCPALLASEGLSRQSYRRVWIGTKRHYLGRSKCLQNRSATARGRDRARRTTSHP